MDKYDLIYGVFQGKSPEQTPISVWKHFPGIDRTPEGLSEAEITFQKTFDPDLMKISPHGRYCVVDWGCVVGPGFNPVSGSTSCSKCCIKSLEDWEELEPVDPNSGEFGDQLKAVQLISKNLGGIEVPKMMTIFSPFMVASKLDPLLLTHIREDPNTIHEGLEIILEVMTEFGSASLDSGAEGLFLASQHLSSKHIQESEAQEFEIRYLAKLLQNLGKKPKFSVMHLHGEDIYFDLASKNLKVDAFNWHDQQVSPTLSEASKIFSGALLGGIDDRGTLRNGTPDDVETQINMVLRETPLDRLILGPGCVIPIDAPDENILAVIKSTQKEES